MEQAKLEQLLARFVADLGGAFSVPLVRIGDRLGLYKALCREGPADSHALSKSTGLDERYLREWLSAQAASGYIEYDPDERRFSMTDEQAAVLADEHSPVFLAPAFDCAAAYLENQTAVEQAFQNGGGVAWGDQTQCLSCAVAKFFRPGYEHHLLQEWLPALDGMINRLHSGIDVADVGCGHGHSTLIMAKAFPNSHFTGFDFHDYSIAQAREHAERHGLENVRFETSLAKSYPGNYDLVTIFDCLHDMGDPAGAMRHVRSSLHADGRCMIVEPAAGDNLQDNLNPVGRLYYSASTMVCVPTSLAQEVGTALGAQAGEGRLRETVVEGGGFGSLTQVAATPFNMVLEARLPA